MNAQVATPINATSPLTELQRALKAAQRQEAAAVDALGAADRDLANKRKLVESCQRDADQASAAIGANVDMLAAEHLANQARAADVRLSTSRNMLAKAKTTREMVQGELQAAQRAANEVAESIFCDEVRALGERYFEALSTVHALRAQLAGAYQCPGRKALRPLQWLRIDTPKFFNFEQLGIGSPGYDVPVNQLQDVTHGLGAEDQCQSERARIEQHAAASRVRLEAISRGYDSSNTDEDAT
ncbi:MAG: hypothetical protein JSR66_03120 [Proteobacteria bacterium]|nr:hypothetical protein [Pseudomonadota bacterium]